LTFLRSRSDLLLPLAALLLFLVIWEVFGRLANPILFSPPSRVLIGFSELLETGRLQRAFLVTLNALTVGFLLSVAVGLPVGLLLGRFKTLADVLEPYINAIYATPRVVMVPLIILWFGVGYEGRVFLIWIGTVIPIIINTAVGVRNARRDLVEVAVSFGANEGQLARHVILPGAVPYIIAGLRIAMGRALVGVIVAEIFLDLTGLGGIIQTESAFFRTHRMLAAVVVISLLGTILISAFGLLERRFSAWKGTIAK
jgi:ABC-type nitrate/sulfonate/bicarbonate transport system permease component